jgi:hypothetical protein
MVRAVSGDNDLGAGRSTRGDVAVWLYPVYQSALNRLCRPGGHIEPPVPPQCVPLSEAVLQDDIYHRDATRGDPQ